MQVIEPGHDYALDSGIISENNGGQGAFRLVFMKLNENGTQIDGTTNEEVIKVLIDRLTFLNEKFPSEHNEGAIKSLQVALAHLDSRTADRVARGVEGTHQA